MAERVQIGGSGALFVGEDKVLSFEVLDSSDVPVNIALFTLNFVVKLNTTDTTELIDVAATVTGVYNATRASNTQRAIVTLTDTHMQASVFKARTYHYSLKRTDDGSETVIAYGPFVVEQASQA